MNAAEQASSLETASKIAAIVNLFKAEFPDARVDLKPWANDSDTREWIDPDSIDLAFHLPGFSRLFQSRSILLQIRFHADGLTADRQVIGAEMAGFDHRGKQWRLSTIESWGFEGSCSPVDQVRDRLKFFLKQSLELFNSPNY